MHRCRQKGALSADSGEQAGGVGGHAGGNVPVHQGHQRRLSTLREESAAAAAAWRLSPEPVHEV